jgi:Nitrile hydratase beta subunit, C-terminal
MQDETREEARTRCGIVYAPGEEASFRVGDHVRVLSRSPIGHYRVPTYLRGKVGIVGAVIEPAAIDNEEETSSMSPPLAQCDTTRRSSRSMIGCVSAASPASSPWK